MLDLDTTLASICQKDIDRFWSKTEKGQECWIWKGTFSKGEGKLSVSGHMLSAPRLSLYLANGNYPRNSDVSKKCGDLLCVNPDHVIVSPKGTSSKGNRFRYNKAMRTRRNIKHVNIDGVACSLIPVGQIEYATVYAEDELLVSCFIWCLAFGYAGRKKTHESDIQSLWMHRIICVVPDGMDVDHINGKTLDNRRCNLRPATRQENSRNRTKIGKQNTSGAIGVSWNKLINKWVSHITLDGVLTHIGVYVDFDEAVAARRKAELDHYGEFAPKEKLVSTQKK